MITVNRRLPTALTASCCSAFNENRPPLPLNSTDLWTVSSDNAPISFSPAISLSLSDTAFTESHTRVKNQPFSVLATSLHTTSCPSPSASVSPAATAHRAQHAHTSTGLSCASSSSSSTRTAAFRRPGPLSILKNVFPAFNESCIAAKNRYAPGAWACRCSATSRADCISESVSEPPARMRARIFRTSSAPSPPAGIPKRRNRRSAS